MQRLLGSMDTLVAAEVHADPPPLTAAGGSAGSLQWMDAWSKAAPQVYMGSLETRPLGQGHDTGIMRPHVLVAAPPVLVNSAAASLKATLMSSCKPNFSAHLVQIGVGGDSLPVMTEVLPFVNPLVCVNVCGSPFNVPQPVLPTLIPTQISVFTTLTAGDIVGGVLNMAADVGLSFLLGKLGGGLGEGVTNLIVKEALSWVLPLIPIVGKVTGVDLDVSVDNPARVVQELIDRDGVDSDARTDVKIFGPAQKVGPPQGE